MFIELLKYKKQAEALDEQGLIREANIVDSRIKRMSNFLSSLHTLNISKDLLDKLTSARKCYDRYMKKKAAWDDDGDYMDRYDDPNYDPLAEHGVGTVWDESRRSDDDNYVVEPDEPEFDIGTLPKRKEEASPELSKPEGHKQHVQFDASYLASLLGGTSDKRYFLDLTTSPIMDENGNLSADARKNNPEGVVIYLIAYPDEQKKPENAIYQKHIKGGFSKISQEQAMDILIFYSESQNREIFPGMCLDLFAQLMMKAREEGGKVEDKVIDSLSPEAARTELYGRDPVSAPDEETELGGTGGRMANLYEYLGKKRSIKDNLPGAYNSVKGYWKRHTDRIDKALETNDYTGLFGGIVGTAVASAEKGLEHEGKTKRIYPDVGDFERKLLGGDAYGTLLLKELQQVAGELGYSIDRNTTEIPEEVTKALMERWDFSILERSPFASKASSPAVSNKFNVSEEYANIVREVINDEKQKQISGEDAIEFFVTNPEDVVLREIMGLGMLLRFQEFSMKMLDEVNLSRATKRLEDKIKASDGDLQASMEEEEEIIRYTGNYYTLSIDPESGALNVRPDSAAKVVANKARKKAVIREAGISLSEEGGKEELNREAVQYAQFIALKYTRPMTISSMDEQAAGDEGAGRSAHEAVPDMNQLTPEELYALQEEAELTPEQLLEIQKETEKSESKRTIDELDVKARSLFRYLSQSSRALPALLGFRKAYQSGIAPEYNKYLAIVKDMIIRSEGFDSKPKKSFSDETVRDEEWYARIEAEHQKEIQFVEINKDGTATVIFDDGEGETIINSQPRSQEQLVQDEETQERQMSSNSLTGTALHTKAVEWMRKFNVDEVIAKVNMNSFNVDDPEGAFKEDFPERQLARAIIMDDEFHERFTNHLNEQKAENPDWPYDEGIAAKPKAASGTGGINQDERTFNLGRMLAYLHFVCGIGTRQLGAFVLEGETTAILGSYVEIVKKFYDEFRSENSAATAEDIGEAMPVIIKEIKSKDKKTGEVTIKPKRVYPIGRGPEGTRRLTAISNRDGVQDVDNVLLLASRYYPNAETLKKGHETLGFSEQGSKSFYLMRLKYIMDAFRLGALGQAELSSAFKEATRSENNVASAALACGDFSERGNRAERAMLTTMAKFEKEVATLEDGQPVALLARDALGEITNIKDFLSRKLEESKKQFDVLRIFTEKLSDYLRNYEAEGRPLLNMGPETSVAIYDEYMRYLSARYGDNPSVGGQRYISELVETFSSLNANGGELQENVEGNKVATFEHFMKSFDENKSRLETHIETGIKLPPKGSEKKEEPPQKDLEGIPETAPEEIPETATEEVTDEIPEEITEEIPPVIEQQPAVAPQVAPQTVQQAEPFEAIPDDIDRKMEYLMQKGNEYRSARIPANSQEYNMLVNLGFRLRPGDPEGTFYWLAGTPDGYMQYWKSRGNRERAEKRRNKISAELNRYIVFGNREIDYILDEYGV